MAIHDKNYTEEEECTTEEERSKDEKQRYRRITIPYVEALSQEFKQEMEKFEILLSFKTYKTIRNIMRLPKDP